MSKKSNVRGSLIYLHTHTTKLTTLQSKHSQSALEYMMTYGWAILIIVIVAAGLYSLGIFNPSSSAGTTVMGFSGLGTVTAQCSSGGFELLLGNSLGVTINITAIKVVQSNQISTQVFPSRTALPNNFLISPQSSSEFIVLNVCPNSTSRFSAQVSVNYTEPGQVFSGTYVSTGTVTGISMQQYNLYGANLIGEWPFYEDSGSTVHSISQTPVSGTFFGSGIHWANCKFGSCLNFSTATPTFYVYVPSQFKISSTAYSFASWVYVQRNPISANYYYAGVPGASTDGWYMGASTNYHFFQTLVNTGNSYITCSSSITFTPLMWYFVVFTFNGTTLVTYVNGQANQCAYSGTPQTLNSGFEFGDYAGIGTSDFNGSMENIEIWNTSLTSSEVGALYASSVPNFAK